MVATLITLQNIVSEHCLTNLHKLAMIKTYPNAMRLFLWQNRVLYFGPSPPLGAHRYGTIALHVGIYRPFQIKVGKSDPVSCRCAVVPANIQHELDFAGGIHGKLFIERNCDDFLYFQQKFPCQQQVTTCFHDTDTDTDTETVDCFRWIYEEDPQKQAVAARLDGFLKCNDRLKMVVDPRVQTTINLIRSEPDCNFSKEQLARTVDLSASRFLHLFREQTGVPYRRFRMWKRLLLAVEQFSSCDNMTRVAMDSGFADATHFSHCFRDMFGINPAFVFRGIKRFEV